jgi:hypothetical protein
VAVALAAGIAGLLLRDCGSRYFGAADSDLVNYFYPSRVFVERWFSRGVFPLWDPHIFGGVPVLELQQVLALNPIRLLSTWFFSARVSIAVETASYAGIAIASMWFACRRLFGCPGNASLLAVLSFVAGGVFTMRAAAGHITVLAAMCWWPLAAGLTWAISRQMTAPRGRSTFSSLLRGLARTRSVRWIAALAATHAMVLLSGAPQYVVYLFWVEVIALLITAVDRQLALIACAFSWAAGLCLSAPQWLPTLWYLPYSARAGGGSFMLGAPGHDLLVVLLETLLRRPFGDDLHQLHLYTKAAWETITYPGAVALALATALVGKAAGGLVCRGIRHLRRDAAAAPLSRLAEHDARALFVSVILLVGVYLTCGGWLPGFSSFREPIKARALLALGFALCAAVQFDRVFSAPRAPRHSPVPVILAGLILTVSAAVLLGLSHNPSWFAALIAKFPPPMDPGSAALYRRTVADPQLGMSVFQDGSTWALIALAATTAILLLGLARSPKFHALGAAALLAVAFADLAASHWIAFPSRHVYDRVELDTSIRDEVTASRSRDPERALPWRLTLPPQVVNRSHFDERIMETGGYDPLMPTGANARNVLDLRMTDAPTSRQLEMVHRALGRRLDCSGQFAGTSINMTSGTCKVVAPSAAIVSIERNVRIARPSRLEAFGPGDGNTNYVSADVGDWASEEPAYVPQWAEEELTHIRPDAATTDAVGLQMGEELTVNLATAPHELTIRTKLSAPALMVARVTWLPGWSARLDEGAWQPALCANRWMLCTPVPAGEHRVEFSYRPVALTASLVMAGGSWVLLLSFGIVTGLRDRRRHSKLHVSAFG